MKNMESLLSNVFGGIFVTTAVAVMAMLVHGFMDECLRAENDVAEVAAIVSGVAVVVGGIIGGVFYYIA